MSRTLSHSRYASRSILSLLAVMLGFLSYGCVGATGDGGTSSNGVLSATPASVGNVSISGAGFSVSGVPSGLTLTPGQTAAMTVTFAPSSAGAATGKVTVADQSSSTPLAITLSGNGVAGGKHPVTLSWNASTSSVAGYRTYRATTPGGPYTSLNSSPNPLLKFTDSTAQSGATYYYVVTAVAADTVESTYSTQVSAVIPKP
jgi:hypothetical protein